MEFAVNGAGMLLIQAGLAGNILLAAGLGLGQLDQAAGGRLDRQARADGPGSFPEGPDKLKAMFREAGTGVLVVTGSVSLARWMDFYLFQFYLPSSFRVLIFFLTAYLVLKAAAIYGRMKARDGLVPLALAVTLWARGEEMFALEAAGYALGAALGVGLALVLVSSVMERLDFSPAAKGYRAVPFFFFALGILSLIFRVF